MTMQREQILGIPNSPAATELPRGAALGLQIGLAAISASILASVLTSLV